MLKGHFEASDVSMSNVFFYASDGASVVYSEGGGVPGLIQRGQPQATSCALLVPPLRIGPEGFG